MWQKNSINDILVDLFIISIIIMIPNMSLSSLLTKTVNSLTINLTINNYTLKVDAYTTK